MYIVASIIIKKIVCDCIGAIYIKEKEKRVTGDSLLYNNRGESKLKNLTRTYASILFKNCNK